MFPQAISYDRRGEIWKSFEPGFGQYKVDPKVWPEAAGNEEKASAGRPEWSWNWLISNDIQSKRITRLCHSQECSGGWNSNVGEPLGTAGEFINNYMTQAAMRRLGT